MAKVEERMPRTPSPIDGYLATVPGDRRAALERLRRTLRAIVPEAEECLSYGIPAFRLDGKVVAGFAATRKGCSFYPFSGSTLGTLATELKGHGGTRSSLHFSPAKGLPPALVRKLLHARRAEIDHAAMTDTASLLTAAKIAAALKVSDARVKKVIAALGVKPAAKKGVCSYYTKADLAKIKKALA
jgi:uncharacterized protein YdhG (YjbR/CyaY superfamily)